MEFDLISIVVSVLATWFFVRYYFMRKKKWNEKIAELESHAEYLEKIRKSSVELNRQAFTRLFLILFLISLGLFLPAIGEYFSTAMNSDVISKIMVPFKFIVYMAATMFAFMEFRTFSDVVNYKKANLKIEEKIQKLNKKVDDA